MPPTNSLILFKEVMDTIQLTNVSVSTCYDMPSTSSVILFKEVMDTIQLSSLKFQLVLSCLARAL
jgi:hypothetical protein